LSGGGLQTPRTLSVNSTNGDILNDGWRVSAAYRDQAVAALNTLAAARAELSIMAIALPIALVLVALVLSLSACRALIRLRGVAQAASKTHRKIGERADEPLAKGTTHAAY
jgi:hypothetical protein